MRRRLLIAVHLPATRWGLLPLKRLTEEERIETVGRFREFAENRNNPTKLKKLARGVMVHPKYITRNRGRGPGQGASEDGSTRLGILFVGYRIC